MNAPKTLEAALKIAAVELASMPALVSVTITLECGLVVSIDREGRITQA